MSRSGFRWAAVAGALTIFGMIVSVEPAIAHTCSSLCSQVQRACTQQSKAMWDQARYACGQEGDACVADCEANAETCPGDCDAAAAACVSGCAGDVDCEAGCAAAQGECLAACENCEGACADAEAACLDQASADRSVRSGECSGARETCSAQCVDPIDSSCVQDCTRDEHACGGDASHAYGQCKRGCPTGSERQACTKGCKNDAAAAREACKAEMILCLAGPADSCIVP